MTAFISLFIEFFKIGLFSVGGGLSTLPFLYELADKSHWFSYADVSDMVAISESTPGPLGVNMSTYTGFQFSGPLGSFVATIALVMPSVIIIIWVSKFLEKFRSSPHVDNGFHMLRPAVTGLVAAAGFGVIVTALFHTKTFAGLDLAGILSAVGVKECILFVLMWVATNKIKRHPVVFIVAGAIIGIIFAF